jgi:ribose 1,5-bisphosphokinase PhnN
MQAKQWREGNKNSYRKSKRRSLRRIIQREQTAKGRTEHDAVSSYEFKVSS